MAPRPLIDVARRGLALGLSLLLIALAIFGLLSLAPGDPLAHMPLTLPPEVRAAMREAMGLDAPWPARLALWLRQVLVIEPLALCDALLGTAWAEGLPRLISWHSHTPVTGLIADRLPQTLRLMGLAYLLGLACALPLGLWQAHTHRSPGDHAASALTMTAYALPPFVTALLLIWLFSITLGWLPSGYDPSHRITDAQSLWIEARQLLLPVIVLSLQITAQLARHLRASAIEVLHADHIRTARAKGLGPRALLTGHVMRHAMVPVITLMALGLPQVFGGAIITEQVFAINGIGHLLISSIHAGDLPVVQTITLLIAVLVVLANLLADAAYRWLDPRIAA
ncbi:ABC transporter permease [Roseovarius sp. A21]|uniref:ABC transporter permease n=1 Tax=Roseovarius bejariae TaxID=2576383 RepID=A0A844CI53_9RHOB|nr:ABC transporter permease [Roseovarius bejariae]MRU14362.1 ABC transporter permease [Roseovarius bejariae]